MVCVHVPPHKRTGHVSNQNVMMRRAVATDVGEWTQKCDEYIERATNNGRYTDEKKKGSCMYIQPRSLRQQLENLHNVVMLGQIRRCHGCCGDWGSSLWKESKIDGYDGNRQIEYTKTK